MLTVGRSAAVLPCITKTQMNGSILAGTTKYLGFPYNPSMKIKYLSVYSGPWLYVWDRHRDLTSGASFLACAPFDCFDFFLFTRWFTPSTESLIWDDIFVLDYPEYPCWIYLFPLQGLTLLGNYSLQIHWTSGTPLWARHFEVTSLRPRVPLH